MASSVADDVFDFGLDHSLAELVSERLEGSDCRVALARTDSECFDLIEAHDADLILLDLGLIAVPIAAVQRPLVPWCDGGLPYHLHSELRCYSILLYSKPKKSGQWLIANTGLVRHRMHRWPAGS